MKSNHSTPADASPAPRWLPDELARKAQVESGQTVIANRKRDFNLIRWAKERGLHVYIGRRNASDPGRFGNPFVLASSGDRDEVCDNFAAHLKGNPELQARVPELRGKVLECFCYPLRCHGLSYIEQLQEGAERPNLEAGR